MNAVAKIRAVYVTIVEAGHSNNGGSIVCRQHIEQLASLSNIDLSVCLIGPADTLDAGEQFAASLGCKCYTIPFGDTHKHRSVFPTRLAWGLAALCPLPFEVAALTSTETNAKFKTLCELLKPEIIIIEYLFSALFIPSAFEMKARRILITQNREADFFKQALKIRPYSIRAFRSWLGISRLRLFEDWAYSQSSIIVALSAGDLPRRRANRLDLIIRPILDHRKPRWSDSGSDELFFVGNAAHYPNYLAMRWLCEKFSPELAIRKPSAVIRIIGATAEEVPKRWRQPNISFDGTGTKEQVLDRLTNCAFLIAPIQNDYGSKIKILECLAHGTPTFGTKEAYSGLDAYEGLPIFALDNPSEAAQLATELLSDRTRLSTISAQAMAIVDRMKIQSDASYGQLISSAMQRAPLSANFERFKLAAPVWGTPKN